MNDIIAQTEQAIAACEKIQRTHACFNHLLTEAAREQAKHIAKKIEQGTAGALAGTFVTIKDNISVQGAHSRAGSAVLNGYTALYDATAVHKLREQDAIILGITSMDEFGFGSWNVNVGNGFETPKNAHDTAKVAGGSSGGAAIITALANFKHIALAESTGGSIETPAALNGVIGFCPTYGRISRHGLISYADSLDKIGFMTKTASEIPTILHATQGIDTKDGTSSDEPIKEAKTGSYTIGVIAYDKTTVDPTVHETFQQTIHKLEQAGHAIKRITLPTTMQHGVATYYILAMCESSTNLAMYCGLRYGAQENPEGKTHADYFTDIRTKHFGVEAKRRIILGTYMRSAGYRDQYYVQAAKVRQLIIQEHAEQFTHCDVIVSPTLPELAPTIQEAQQEKPTDAYNTDIFTTGPNLAGIPHASVPLTKEIGLLASTPHNDEYTLIEFLHTVEALK